MNHEYSKISEYIVKGKREETKVKTWLCCELVLNGLTQNVSLGGVIHKLPPLAFCFRFTINETKSHNWDVWDEVSGIVGKN
jgi:hypothetical protein